MRLQVNRKGVALGLVIGLIGGAAGGALATSGGSSAKSATTTTTTTTTAPTPGARVQAFLSDLAGRLNVSVAQLEDAIKGAATDQVDQALKDGTITQAQADALTQAIQSGRLPFGLGMPGLRGPGGLRGLGHGLGVAKGDVVSAAASYLGLTEAQLETQLRSGKSLADVAGAQGKSVSGLEDALVAAVSTAVNANASLSAAEKTAIVSAFKAGVGVLVNATLPAGMPGLGFGHGGAKGFGFFGGRAQARPAGAAAAAGWH